MGWLDRIWVSRKMHPVFFPNIRRATVERFERKRLVRDSVPNLVN